MDIVGMSLISLKWKLWKITFWKDIEGDVCYSLIFSKKNGMKKILFFC